ncbi:hypothetical protein RJT34_22218 [Clitoria ternatea]|uniref:NB-ARC domain-containing protein n=1 Tax=Clitoria ternatea TaxID=43366 RepID=A0AAN9IVX7_CLITE
MASSLTKINSEREIQGKFRSVIYAEKFQLRKEVSSWRIALREAAGLAGFVVLNSRNESEDIKNIVEHVTHLLDKTELFVAKHPVGMESRLQAVIKLLNNKESKDVLFLGIWGMGGIGKTTIAKAIYNQMRGDFEGRSFVQNIRDSWEQDSSQVSLQQRVLYGICKSTTLKLLNIESGKNILKKRLAQKRGTKAIKGLALKLPKRNTICLKTKTFKKMNSLKLLQLSGVQLDGDFKYLSRDLRWLYWNDCPLTCIPTEFHQGSLVVIELKYSRLKQTWQKPQMLKNLKILNLSHSHDLTETPDFSFMPNLEKLLLKDCPSLSEVSHTIGYLNELLLLNLEACTGLLKLPRSIYKLKSLETLILSGCSKIDKLEEDLEQMKSLTTLIADNTAIKKVPFSIIRSKSIGYISLCGFEGFARDVFPSLIWSWMSPRNILSSLAQTDADMSSVVVLDGPNRSSHSLSSTLNDLHKLQSLYVVSDSRLQLTQDVGRILDILKATDYKLEASASTSQISDMKMFPLIACHGQVHNLWSKNSLKFLLIQMGAKSQVLNILKEGILQTTDEPGDFFSLPGDNYSEWLTFHCKDNTTSEGCQNVLIINYTKTTILVYKSDTLISFADEEWQNMTSNLEPGNEVEIIVVFRHRFIVEKTTVYLLYDEMEHCHAVDKDVDVSGDNGVAVCHDVNDSGDDDIATDKNFIASGDNVTADKNSVVSDGDENVTDSKDCHAVDKDVIVSCNDDDMEEAKDSSVPGGDDMPTVNNAIVFFGHENRLRRIFFMFPPLVRAILISRPIWFGLVGILVWITFHLSKRLRRHNLITRYTQKGKWLVDYITKLLTYKKVSEASNDIANAIWVDLEHVWYKVMSWDHVANNVKEKSERLKFLDEEPKQSYAVAIPKARSGCRKDNNVCQKSNPLNEED